MVVGLTVNLDDLHWEQVEVIIELKYTETPNLKSESATQIWQNAKFIFRNQHNRRFVLGLRLLGTKMSLMYIDRSGVLVSSTFDVHEDPRRFIRVLAGLVYVDKKYLGYDTSVSVAKRRGHAFAERKPYTVENIVHVESGTLGRGTVCFEVTDHPSDPTEQRTYALKDAWVDVSRVQKEAPDFKGPE